MQLIGSVSASPAKSMWGWRNQDNGEESRGEGVNVIEWEYNSDGELGQALGRKQGASEDDDESIGMGQEDAFARQRGDVT